MVIYGVATLIAAFITITSYMYYIDVEDMSWCKDNIVGLLVLFVIACLLMKGLAAGISKSSNPARSNHILFGVVFAIIMAGTAWWIINARSLAQNDLQSLHDIALQIISGDYSAVAPKDSYLSLWPFQSGILLYYEMILRLVPEYNVVPMECLNWVYLGLGLFSAYQLVRKWFDEQTVTCFTVLLLFCLPWYFYVNFAYGEMPSICLMFFATWMISVYMEKSGKRYLFLALAGVFLGGLVRKNLTIFVVACVLISGVLFVITLQKKNLYIVIGLLVVTWMAGSIPVKLYEFRAGNTMGDGVSAFNYVAMGLQETPGISPGWNNGYHSEVLIENGYNTASANELSKESIQSSLQYMVHHPAYAASFFFRKLVPEWCDESYSCLYSTSQRYYGRTDAAWRIYAGDRTEPVLGVMNAYQSVLYTGFFLFCIQAVVRRVRRRNKKIKEEYSGEALWKLVLMVTIIGGFLFYIFWEGGSRYTLPYMVCMLPYAAGGIAALGRRGQ